MKTAYLASPYGFTEPGMAYAGVVVSALERAGLCVLDPWRDSVKNGDALRRMRRDPQGMRRLNHAIAERNASDIRAADLVVAVLDGADVDSGVASEIGYAFCLGKLIHGYRSDTRRSGDNEAAAVNLQIQYFIECSGGCILLSLESLEAALSAGDANGSRMP